MHRVHNNRLYMRWAKGKRAAREPEQGENTRLRLCGSEMKNQQLKSPLWQLLAMVLQALVVPFVLIGYPVAGNSRNG